MGYQNERLNSEKKEKGFLQDYCDVVIIRGSLGYGDTIALTALFRELKRLNPLGRTTLKTCPHLVNDILVLMKGQPYPDRIVSAEENVKRNIPYYEFDLSASNFEYEQQHKPNVSKSRSGVNLEVLGLPGNSKPFYLLREEDIEWCEKQPIPRWFTFVQLNGRENYKSCDMEQLLVYCRAVVNSLVLGDIVIVSPPSGSLVNTVKKIEDHIYLIECPDIRKAIALMARSMVCIGFDSVFLHASAALDVPFLGLLGPTSCQGRISDHRHAAFLRSESCSSCFKWSIPVCPITGSKDKSACLYNIDSERLVRKLEELKDRKGAAIGSVKLYSPEEYYTKDFDPSTQKFVIDNPNISKIHQPVHNDGSYKDKWQIERVKWIVEHAITEEGVLDIGCSNGFIVDSMLPPKEGYRHCGIDYDSDRIRLAKQTKKKDIDFYVLDARYGLPFPDRSFSTVVLAEVLEHLDLGVARTMLEEAYRVSKDKVLITMPFAGEDYHENPDRVKMVESADHKWKVTTGNLDILLEGYTNSRKLDWFAFIEIKNEKEAKNNEKKEE